MGYCMWEWRLVLIGFGGQNLAEPYVIQNVPDCTLTATSECVNGLTAMIGLLAQIQVYHSQARISCL